MYHQQSFGKSAKSKRTASNVNTVNLGLHCNSLLNERVATNVTNKSDGGQLYPTTYTFSPALGNTNHNSIKVASQRKKERPRSGCTSYKSSHYSNFQNSSQTKSSSVVKSKQVSRNTSSSLCCYSSSLAFTKTISPVENVVEDDLEINWRSQDLSALPKTQVYLPGDRVIFAESPSAPGVPIIYRLDDERHSNPDKLNLDRRKLSVCPILEGEEQLRLLNFQHNSIRKIKHLSMLQKLIFLDLYDNQVEEISGLSCLKSLRVLMLGKNRIKKIKNLQELSMLDVLDLHGNKISVVENLSHLHQLRVLNLAGNELTVVKNLSGLDSLSELNLRRNYIHNIQGVDELPSLQRLFLSFNELKTFEDMSCLSGATALIELSIDGNPFANADGYKQTVLRNVTTLKQLDMKRLSEEEKRIACVMARKEEDRKKEQERLSSIKERRRLAINNAQREWKRQFKSKDRHDVSPKRSVSEMKEFSTCHLAELEHDTLCLYGSGSLDALDKNWGEKTSTSVTTVVFKFISFEDIVPNLAKLNTRFPGLTTLEFDKTNICTLNEINALASLHQIENLSILQDGNPVTKLSLWKPYLIFRLANLQLKTLNGLQIAGTDIVHAEKLFSAISHMATTKLSQTRLLTLINKQSQANVTTDNTGSIQSLKHSAKNRTQLGDGISKAGLIYNDTSEKTRMELQERNSIASNYIQEILNAAVVSDRKQKLLETILPQFFSDLVGKYCKEISDVDTYCETSLQKIKRSVNVTY